MCIFLYILELTIYRYVYERHWLSDCKWVLLFQRTPNLWSIGTVYNSKGAYQSQYRLWLSDWMTHIGYWLVWLITVCRVPQPLGSRRVKPKARLTDDMQPELLISNHPVMTTDEILGAFQFNPSLLCASRCVSVCACMCLCVNVCRVCPCT